MQIRPERKEEFPAIYALVEEAFQTAERADGDEQEFVNKLRAAGGYIPALALVAEEGGALIGHIMLTETSMQNVEKQPRLLLLAPLSVKLAYRRRGVGAKLVNEALLRAKGLGYEAVALAGNPKYYGRFGFLPMHRYGLSANMEVPEELLDCMMITGLVPGALSGVQGGVVELMEPEAGGV